MSEKEIKVDVHVLCYNEEKIVPFMLDYWDKFATNVYVYDNYSTDRSVELLSKETRFNVEIIYTDTENKFNDMVNVTIKNNDWKKSRGESDFVVVSDFDEALYSENIMSELLYMKNNKQTICFPEIYELYSLDFPVYDKNKLIHEIVENGMYNKSFGKKILFNPNEISEINYSVGAHNCNPIGNINYYDRENIFMFHCKQLSIDYVIKKYRDSESRLSDVNKQYNWGVQYAYPDDKIVKILKDELDSCVKLNTIFKNENTSNNK